MTDYRGVSFWMDSLPEPIVPRPALPGDIDVDVAILGAGFTGLWTAYSLSRIDPALRIAVLERDVAGFGASGRNGGWCVGQVPPGVDAQFRRWGERGIALARAAQDTVDEIAATVEREGIDCHFAKGGALFFATNAAQWRRVRARYERLREIGFGEDDYRLLTPRETTALMNAAGVHGGLLHTQTAALHPARLARGLADVVEQRGVTVYEQTAVTRIDTGQAVTEHGTVRANVVVRALEGYTASLAGHERALVPIHSLMIATAPLGKDVWDEIGMETRPTFEDARFNIFYGQRTADGRIAFGGLAEPYRYQSGIDTDLMAGSPVHERLRQELGRLFPVLRDVEVTHRWGGVLGAPRDWTASVGYDKSNGFAWGGGYVGEGVAAANLAGRTLADLICGRDTDLTTLPWVGHRSRPWEPEPLRWLGINAATKALTLAERSELRGGRRRRWADALVRRLAD